MKVVETTDLEATVSLTRFEIAVILHAVTSLEDLETLGLAFLDPARQPGIDTLYGDLYRLAESLRLTNPN